MSNCLSETLQLSSIIRVHQVESVFARRHNALLDSFNRAGYLFIHMQRWLSIRIESIAAVLIAATALQAVLNDTLTDQGGELVSDAAKGLSIAYVLQVTASLTWCIRQISESEKMMASVQRMLDLGSGLGVEEDVLEGDGKVEALEKESGGVGTIEFVGVDVKYDTEGPLALRDVSVSISPGSRVGLVGKSGSGKSTLISTIVRLVKVSKGMVKVNGLDIYKQSLESLRSNVFVIPQDSVLFSGSLRSNVDPSHQFKGMDERCINIQ
jgi:ABC-type multidrug transport system fused ATPase/permease subunit